MEGLDPKQLRGLIDENKKKLGSGVSALGAVVDGRASIAVGVTDDLISDQSAVDLVRVGVETLGGKGGGGRTDMAQGGGPDAAKAAAAIEPVKAALAGEIPTAEERRVGKECVRTCRSRSGPDH